MPETPPPRRSRMLAASATLAASGLLMLGAAGPAAAVVIEPAALTITAAPAAVSVGDTVTVTASATGLVDAYAYELDIAYDPDLLSFVADSEVVPSGGFGSSSDDGDSVSVVATRLGTSPGLVGDVDLVTLTFTAIAPGDAEIAVAAGSIVDSAAASSVIDTEGVFASVAIAAEESEGSAGSSGSDDSTGSDGSTPTPAAESTSSTADGSLATTGTDAALWLLVGGVSVAAIAVGSLIAVRRKTR